MRELNGPLFTGATIVDTRAYIPGNGCPNRFQPRSTFAGGSMNRRRAVSDTMTMPIFRRAAKVSAIFQSDAATRWENPGRGGAIKRVIFSPGGDIETLFVSPSSRRRDLARNDNKDGRRSLL